MVQWRVMKFNFSSWHKWEWRSKNYIVHELAIKLIRKKETKSLCCFVGRHSQGLHPCQIWVIIIYNSNFKMEATTNSLISGSSLPVYKLNILQQAKWLCGSSLMSCLCNQESTRKVNYQSLCKKKECIDLLINMNCEKILFIWLVKGFQKGIAFYWHTFSFYFLHMHAQWFWQDKPNLSWMDF